MTNDDHWSDPLDAQRHEHAEAEAGPEVIHGHGLGMAGLGDHGLGAGRLRHHGLGDAHPADHPHTHGHEHAGHHGTSAPHVPGLPQPIPGQWHPPDTAQLVSPIPHDHHKVTEPPKLPPPLYSGSIEQPVRVSRRQWLLAVVSLAVLAGLIALVLQLKPSGGGQFEELGQKLGQGPARQYKYVSDSQRQLYWPNEVKYVEKIPKADREYIRDEQDLAGHSNYKAGTL